MFNLNIPIGERLISAYIYAADIKFFLLTLVIDMGNPHEQPKSYPFKPDGPDSGFDQRGKSSVTIQALSSICLARFCTGLEGKIQAGIWIRNSGKIGGEDQGSNASSISLSNVNNIRARYF
ncbi:hypothetical protein NO559_16370 [Dasania sp. GY-MA-18]|uniref:hypothetical protein n=1 Tax=Dasania sp. GY-MA-18 TaxID=2966584 RepID=UPI0021AC9814|nr:hypothetical protein [Dasania sp. GY-MA-18]MCR8924351.1 hypothetical protein [Dasania sp. GY-MA-18]